MIAIIGLMAVMLFKYSLVPYSDRNFFSVDVQMMLGVFILGILYPFSMPELWRRVYSSKNKKVLKKGLLLSAAFYFIFALFLSLVALGIKSRFPGIDPDIALIYGFKNFLPSGFLGLSVVLLFAAIMSSLDTYLFTGASAVVQDFFNFSRHKIVTNIRKVIVVLAIVATGIAILITDLFTSAYIFVAAAIVLSVISVATWVKKDINERTLIFGFIFGLVGLFTFLIQNIIKGELNPAIIMVGLAFSVLGLIVGGIISYFKKL